MSGEHGAAVRVPGKGRGMGHLGDGPTPTVSDVTARRADRTEAAASTVAMIWSAALRHDETTVALGLEAIDVAEPSAAFSIAWGLARVAAELVGQGRKLTVGVSTEGPLQHPVRPAERPSGELRVELVIDVATTRTPGGAAVVESTELAASLLAAASRRDSSGALELWRGLDLASRAAVVCELAGLGLVALAEEVVPRPGGAFGTL